MISKYVQERWKGKTSGVVCVPMRRGGIGDMTTVRNNLMWDDCTDTWGNSDSQGYATTQGYVWVNGPIAPGVCVDIYGPCYYPKLCKCPWSVLQPEAMLMFEGWVKLAPPLLCPPHRGASGDLCSGELAMMVWAWESWLYPLLCDMGTEELTTALSLGHVGHPKLMYT